MHWLIPLSILTLSGFLMETTFTMITPFLPLYLVKELHVSAADINLWSGAVYSITFFISGLMGPVWGAISDKGGRKLMALRAAVCLAVGYAACGIVTSAQGLFAARFFMGFAVGLYPALLALVATTMPRDRIGLAMGLLQGGMTIGGIAGPFMGGALSEWVGMRMSFYLGAGALVIVTVLLALCVHEPRGEGMLNKGRMRLFDLSVLTNRVALQMMICSMVVHASLFSIQPILPLYIGELRGTMENISLVSGIVFSACGLPILIASPILGSAGQRFGFTKVLIICLAFAGVLVTLQVVPKTVEGFAIVRIIGGLAVAGLVPMINSVLSVSTDPNAKGRVYGMNFLFGHVGMAGGPMLTGAIAGVIGYDWVIAFSGIILLPLMLWLLLLFRRSGGTMP